MKDQLETIRDGVPNDIIGPGYVQKRRRILTHLQEGRMTLNEYIVFDILLMLANTQTGCGMVNAPAIVYWTGGQLSQQAAKVALQGLDKKDYIVRETVPGKLGLYPYRVQNFEIFWRDQQGQQHVRRTRFDRISNKTETIDELLAAFGAEFAPQDEQESLQDPLQHTLPETLPETLHDITKDKGQGTRDNDSLLGERLRPLGRDESTLSRHEDPPGTTMDPPHIPDGSKPNLPVPPIPAPAGPAANLTQIFKDKTQHWKFKQKESLSRCEVAFAKLLTEHSEDEIAETVGYAADHPMYATGMRTVAKIADPWDWFAKRYDEIRAHMANDTDYARRIAKKIAKTKKAANSATANADKPLYRQVPGQQIVNKKRIEKI